MRCIYIPYFFFLIKEKVRLGEFVNLIALVMCIKHTKIQRNIKLRTQKELIQMTGSHIMKVLHLISS